MFEGIWPQVLEDTRHGSLKRRYDGGLAEINDVPLARHDLLAAGDLELSVDSVLLVATRGIAVGAAVRSVRIAVTGPGTSSRGLSLGVGLGVERLAYRVRSLLHAVEDGPDYLAFISTCCF